MAEEMIEENIGNTLAKTPNQKMYEPDGTRSVLCHTLTEVDANEMTNYTLDWSIV